MSDELPLGWTSSLLEDVFHSFGGGTPNKGTTEYWGGNIPWLSSGDIKGERIQTATESITKAGLANSSASLCRPGSVVVVVRSGILKHTLPVAVLEHAAAINQDIKCFDSGSDELNNWLALALRASARRILTLNREGTTVQSVKYQTLKEFELPIPPVGEQKRIVMKLGALLAKVGASQQRLARIPVLLKRFRQSVLTAACSGRLTADWRQERPNQSASSLLDEIRERRKEGWAKQRKNKGLGANPADYPEPVEPSDEFEFDVPESWVTCSMDALTSVITSGSRDWKKYYQDDGSGTFVMAQNIRPLRFDRSYRLAVAPPEDDRDRARSEVFKDDLLVTIVGANTADCCRVTEKLREHYVCQSVALMRPVLPETSRFLELFLNSTGHGAAEWRKWIYGEGRPHLSFDNLRETIVCLPPLPEQHEIVRRVEGLFALADQLELRLTKACEQVDRLTPALLARAFAGRLVPQDPNDEPASALLEQIRLQGNGDSKNRYAKEKENRTSPSRNRKTKRR